jgi:hypothetical protein
LSTSSGPDLRKASSRSKSTRRPSPRTLYGSITSGRTRRR